MSLGDEIATALPLLREQARSRMHDACIVRRVVDTDVDDDGNVTPVYSDPVYDGVCRVQTTEPQERAPEIGAAGTVTVQRYAVHIPSGSYRPVIGDVVTISTAVDDPNLVDRDFRVVGLLHKSQATAYRLAVEELPA
ncbi:DUF6093 family protein [Cellulomonas palmilytica]|uniref:DUF6093 family protein n=1 Tax=Cellulomonas palmilytica TaxID=2608402 RepID=UPI001F28DB6E|nr:DUF6093 family protein [Cellulomonas palmilytica]UJP39330.1 hypothetical protein F1D97_13430 [Cellulomonas palmilytica]